MEQFQEIVWEHYGVHGRDLPWRHEPFNAYRILVSEIMLQQTQAQRVVPKYHEFLRLFPTIESLAQASLADLLKAWSGLGYNRRAKYLREAAKQLVKIPEPWHMDDLIACKGIGFNTAAAVVTYAYNQAVPFIETNIRTVYIQHFFQDQDKIADKDILPLVAETLDRESPRDFMWALMDYGSHLKKTVGNASRASKHYAKQSKFEGSRRQLRGQVLRLLAAGPMTIEDLAAHIADERLISVITELVNEALVNHSDPYYNLGS